MSQEMFYYILLAVKKEANIYNCILNQISVCANIENKRKTGMYSKLLRILFLDFIINSDLYFLIYMNVL